MVFGQCLGLKSDGVVPAQKKLMEKNKHQHSVKTQVFLLYKGNEILPSYIRGLVHTPLNKHPGTWTNKSVYMEPVSQSAFWVTTQSSYKLSPWGGAWVLVRSYCFVTKHIWLITLNSHQNEKTYVRKHQPWLYQKRKGYSIPIHGTGIFFRILIYHQQKGTLR